MFFTFDAFDVDHHHWLVIGEAVLGEEVGKYSVHFEGFPRFGGCQGAWRVCRIEG